jgi:cytoskeleton protein RodZ
MRLEGSWSGSSRNTMESIGEFFKQVRETKGLTLDDVASKTRIHPDFLIALEAGNFTKLPDQVFAKGFVRSYARSLGLEEEDAMRRFEGSAGAFYEKQAEREQLRVKQAEDERRKKTNRKVVLAGLAVGLLGLVLLMSREHGGVPSVRPVAESDASPLPRPTPFYKDEVAKKDESAKKDEVAKEAISTVQTATVASVPPPPPSVAAVTQSSREETAASIPSRSDAVLGTPPADSLVLGIEALELTWVVVQVDNGGPEEALLRPGERVQWKATDRFTLTLGNAGGVRVEMNGKEQGPFGSSGKVIRDIVLKR